MSNRDPLPFRRLVLGAALTVTAAGAAWAADLMPPEISKPVWVQQPTPKDLMRVYPKVALDHGGTGRVVIGCRIEADGTLSACTVEKQSSAKYGFGEAGLRLASYFRMGSQDEDGRRTAGSAIHIPIRFKLMDEPMLR